MRNYSKTIKSKKKSIEQSNVNDIRCRDESKEEEGNNSAEIQNISL